MHKELEGNIENIAELEKNKNFHQILFEIQKINNNQNNVMNRLELMEHKFEKKIQDMTKLMADSLDRIEKFTNNRHRISNESDMSKNSLVESHHADKTIHNDQTENLFKNSWLNQSQRNELLPFIKKHDSEFQQNQTVQVKKIELIEIDDDDDDVSAISTVNDDKISKSTQLNSDLSSMNNNSITFERHDHDLIQQKNDDRKLQCLNQDCSFGSALTQSNGLFGINLANQTNSITKDSQVKIFDSNNVIQSRFNKHFTSKPRIILPSQDRLIPLNDQVDENKLSDFDFTFSGRKKRSKSDKDDFDKLYSCLDLNCLE